MIERDEHKTAVVFRKWGKKKGGGIIALFPELPADANGYYVLSYEHIGQHGGADYNGVIARTVPASIDESTDLIQELESIGYNLQVCQRQKARMREKCHGRAI